MYIMIVMEAQTVKKIKDVEKYEESLLDDSIAEIKESISDEESFEKDLKEFETELTKLEEKQKTIHKKGLFGRIMHKTNDIQMSEDEKMNIEREASSLPNEETNEYVLEEEKLGDLREQLSHLESFLSKQTNVQDEKQKDIVPPENLSIKKPKLGFSAPKKPENE